MPEVSVVRPLERPGRENKTTIFLAGTISQKGQPDWRLTLTARLTSQLANATAGQDVLLVNPVRSDWDATRREDSSDTRWAAQVQWELEMQDAADVMVVFFHGSTAAPISLLELGLCVRQQKAIVCALDEYTKKGNVEAVCQRYGAVFVRTENEMGDAVLQRIMRGRSK